ncbi:MAG: class I SAM-dependent methyltransferase [Mycobacteriales bacterium]
MTDWRAWHDDYDDPRSSLSRRLQVVQQRLDDIARQGSVRRILCLCAGDGRDIIPVLARQPRERRPSAVLVEIDTGLAAAAERRATEAGVELRVVVGDAGLPETWGTVPPVDLLMLCGIFGNITDGDIKATIDAAPALLSPGGVVVWTRGFFADHDLRPQVRQWFREAGFSEIAFDSEPRGYGVGVNRITEVPNRSLPTTRLFSFLR